MTTATIPLPLEGWLTPDASDSSNYPPGYNVIKDSATAPAPYTSCFLFDDSRREGILLQFRMPDNYSSSPVLVLQYSMVSATSGSVVCGGRFAAITSGDAQDVDTKAFATEDTASNAVPATAGYLKEFSITMSDNDSLAAGDFLRIGVYRLGADGSDTATGDMELRSVSLQYTTT